MMVINGLSRKKFSSVSTLGVQKVAIHVWTNQIFMQG